MWRARAVLNEVDAIVPHVDADGLAAGALALRERREAAASAILLGRGRTPFGDDAPLPPGSVAVLDWGVRELTRPGLLVDHHAPEVEPRADQLVVSGYGEKPEVSTAVLMCRIVPESPAWIAAVGAFGDLGERAFVLPECAGVPKSLVRRLVPLVNAPRRLPAGPVREALALLVEHDDPGAALRDPRTRGLERARDEVRLALRQSLTVPPLVRGEAALIRLSTPYGVHPLVAAAWKRRLAPRVVLVANDGYLPGRVNFAVRGGGGDLRRLLRSALPEANGEFAHGHDRATGGSLRPHDFERLLDALGLAA